MFLHFRAILFNLLYVWRADVYRQFKLCELYDGTYEKWQRRNSNSYLLLVYSNIFSRDQYKKAAMTQIVGHYLRI